MRRCAALGHLDRIVVLAVVRPVALRSEQQHDQARVKGDTRDFSQHPLHSASVTSRFSTKC